MQQKTNSVVSVRVSLFMVFTGSETVLGGKKTTTATATGTSLNKSFIINEENNGCARAL